MRGEAFGTRHKATRNPRVARMLIVADRDAEETALARKSGPAPVKDTSQMIFDFQTIKSGAVFWTVLRFADLSDLEVSALQSALSYACRGKLSGRYLFSVAAKASVGFGQTAWDMRGSVRHVSVPDLDPSNALVPISGTRGEIEAGVHGYVESLRENREAILALIEEVA
jgi:hypothetical protein